jgi:hypothetical protein
MATTTEGDCNKHPLYIVQCIPYPLPGWGLEFANPCSPFPEGYAQDAPACEARARCCSRTRTPVCYCCSPICRRGATRRGRSNAVASVAGTCARTWHRCSHWHRHAGKIRLRHRTHGHYSAGVALIHERTGSTPKETNRNADTCGVHGMCTHYRAIVHHRALSLTHYRAWR